MSQPITISLGVLEACHLRYCLRQAIDEGNARISRMAGLPVNTEAAESYINVLTKVSGRILDAAKNEGIEL